MLAPFFYNSLFRSVRNATLLNPIRRMAIVLRNYLAKLRLFNRNIRFFLISGFLSSLGMSFYGTLFNLYLKESKFSTEFVGQMLFFSTLGGLLFALPAGVISTRTNQKLFLIINSFLYVLSSALSVLFPIQNGILICVFIAGIASTFSGIVSAPLIMANTTDKERTYVFSLQFAVGLAGGAIGSSLSGFLSELLKGQGESLAYGYRLTILGGCAIAAVGLVPLVFLKIQPLKPEDKLTISIASIRSLNLRFSLKFLASRALIGLGAGLTIPFLNIYFRDVYHSKPSNIGIYWSLSNGAMLIGALLAPLLSDKLGKVKLIVSSQLLSILFMLGLASAPTESLALIPFLIRVSLMNMSTPIASAFALEMSPKKEQGIINAMLMLSWSLPWSLSTLLGGKLIQNYGFYASFISTSILYLLSSVLFYLFFRNVEQERKVERVAPLPTSLLQK